MKLTIEHGSLFLYFSKNLYIEFECEWLCISNKCYSLNLINVSFENEAMVGSVDAMLYVLGFGMRITWIYDGVELDENEDFDFMKRLEEVGVKPYSQFKK